jgi:hypothetical protein
LDSRSRERRNQSRAPPPGTDARAKETRARTKGAARSTVRCNRGRLKAAGMGVRRRRGLSVGERADLWRRWKDGQSLSDIERALGKAPGSVHGYLSARGGIAPVARRRSDRALSPREREEVSRQLCAGSSLRAIARSVARPPSTVSREVARNGGRGRYRAADADARAWTEGLRPKRCKLAQHPPLRRLIAEKVRLDWSPEQIAGWLARSFGARRRVGQVSAGPHPRDDRAAEPADAGPRPPPSPDPTTAGDRPAGPPAQTRDGP